MKCPCQFSFPLLFPSNNRENTFAHLAARKERIYRIVNAIISHQSREWELRMYCCTALLYILLCFAFGDTMNTLCYALINSTPIVRITVFLEGCIYLRKNGKCFFDASLWITIVHKFFHLPMPSPGTDYSNCWGGWYSDACGKDYDFHSIMHYGLTS